MELDRDTLLALWQARDSAMAGITTIDVAALDRVDSAGLALLVHLLAKIAGAKAGHERRYFNGGASDKLGPR